MNRWATYKKERHDAQDDVIAIVKNRCFRRVVSGLIVIRRALRIIEKVI